MIEQFQHWTFWFGLVSLAIGAAGFLDAMTSRLEILRMRRKVGASANELNVALEASVIDPDELATEAARFHLLSVVIDLEAIAEPPPAYPRPRKRAVAQG